MSLMEKLKKEAVRLKASEKERKTFDKIDWYTPDEGDNNIRLLPHKDKPDDENPFRRVVVHYMQIKKKDGGYANLPFRCLTELDDTCPLCKKFAQLQKAGDKEGAQKFRPAERYLWNVINYKERKVQPYSAPLTVHNEIIGWIDEVDILNRDWRLTKKKGKGIQVEYSVRPSLKDSSITEKMKPLLETMVDLDGLYNENEKKRMLEFIGEEVEEVEDEDLEDDKAERLAAAKAKAAKAKVKAKPEPEEDEEPEFAEPKSKAKPAPKKMAVEEDEEEDEKAEIEVDDDEELTKELQDLGVME